MIKAIYPVSHLIGKTFDEVLFKKTLSRKEHENDAILFSSPEGTYYLTHSQNCCEHVYVEDITGELSDLENVPIIDAREDHNPDQLWVDGHSITWHFYTFTTQKGTVQIRFHGSSNGYYSTAVDLFELDSEV